MGFLIQVECGCTLWAGLCLVALPTGLHAQVVRSAEDLKGLALDQLLQTRIISMSRTLEDWQDAPTAVSVLTAPGGIL